MYEYTIAVHKQLHNLLEQARERWGQHLVPEDRFVGLTIQSTTHGSSLRKLHYSKNHSPFSNVT